MMRLGDHGKYLGWFLVGNLLLVAGYVCLDVSGRLPPPPFAKSISFDEKVVWLHNNAKPNIDLLALGSSMTLNNLSSEVLVAERPCWRFVNASSWGLKIRHVEKFFRLLDGVYKIKSLLICVAPVDFRKDGRPDEVPHRRLIEQYLRGGSQAWAQLILFSGDYFVSNLQKMDLFRNHNDHYQSLHFDLYGGVPLAVKDFAIDQHRWRGGAQTEFDESNYQSLVELANYCRERRIGLYLWTTPVRQQAMGVSGENLFSFHLARLQKLAADEGFVLVEADNQDFDDSMFVDMGHLNEKGARQFTATMLKLMKVKNLSFQ